MIVRPDRERVLLITQPDHAHLARRIMEHCVALSGAARRRAILHAVGEHDCGWEDEDAAPAVDPASGQIVDFVRAPLRVRHRVWPRALERLAGEPWSAALVAQHAITVYDRFRSDTAWSSFFTGMQTARDSLLRTSGRTFDELLADYAFVRLGDLISLAFCTATTGELQFDGWTVRLSGARVLVKPDVFGGATIPFEITAREVPAPPYQSDAALREAVRGASLTMLRGEAAAP